jgi:hypothetical protein
MSEQQVEVTVITRQGASTSGPIPPRDADIVEALSSIAGAVTNRRQSR